MNKISTTLADKDREKSIAHAKKEKNRTKKNPRPVGRGWICLTQNPLNTQNLPDDDYSR